MKLIISKNKTISKIIFVLGKLENARDNREEKQKCVIKSIFPSVCPISNKEAFLFFLSWTDGDVLHVYNSVLCEDRNEIINVNMPMIRELVLKDDVQGDTIKAVANIVYGAIYGYLCLSYNVEEEE